MCPLYFNVCLYIDIIMSIILQSVDELDDILWCLNIFFLFENAFIFFFTKCCSQIQPNLGEEPLSQSWCML